MNRFAKSADNIDIADEISKQDTWLGVSSKVIFRWPGSIYKLIWKPVLLYIATYILLTVLYEYVLNDVWRRDFEALAQYCTKYTSSIPVILLLGFFTSTTMSRWFQAQINIPGLAKPISIFALSLKEDTPNGIEIVRQYSRWLLLSWGLTFRMVCKPLREKYPNLMSLQQAGLLLEKERILLEKEESYGRKGIWPLLVVDWLLHLVKKLNKEGRFQNSSDFFKHVELILTFKKSCGNTLKFASKNIPFALIQAVTITIYVFGLASLMARQFADKSRVTTLLTGYLPLLHPIQYFLYFAWLKFGQAATNPFGEDETDIDVVTLFRNHIDDAARLEALYVGAPKDLPLEIESDKVENLAPPECCEKCNSECKKTN